MRLSEWRATAKHRESVSPRVIAVIESVLASLGAESDPHLWIAWGDDSDTRYTLFAPVAAGLVLAHVRVNVPQEGPRVSARLTRWARLQPGDLALESQGGHRIITFQLEQQVLKGVDREAEAIARFALVLLAAIDGRPWPPFDVPVRRGQAAGRGSSTARGASPASTRTSTRAATTAAAGAGVGVANKARATAAGKTSTSISRAPRRPAG